MNSRFAWWSACLVSGLVAGCGGGPSKISLVGAYGLNPDETGQPRPVKARVYKLKDSRRFLESPMEAVWVEDKKTLAEDWIEDPQVLTVIPGDKPEEVGLGELGGDVKFIGVMALISDMPQGEDTRRVVVPAKEVDGAVFELTGYRVVLRTE